MLTLFYGAVIIILHLYRCKIIITERYGTRMDNINQKSRSAQISAYMNENADCFNSSDKGYVIEALECCDEHRFIEATNISLKDPDTMAIISLLFGIAGIDRFMLKDKFYGFLKLLTFGGLLVLWFSDFKNMKAITKLHNAKCVINTAVPGLIADQSNQQKLVNVVGMYKGIANDPTVKKAFSDFKRSAKNFHDDLYIN